MILQQKHFTGIAIFSDTAKMFEAYQETATKDIGCGWSFWNPSKLLPSGFDGKMKDTIVNGIIYNLIRYEHDKVNKEGINEHWTDLGYFLCGNKTIVYLDKAASKKFGCPLVRYDFSTQVDSMFKEKLWLSDQLYYSPEKLSEKELKVFNTWEQYAKKHPVKN